MNKVLDMVYWNICIFGSPPAAPAYTPPPAPPAAAAPPVIASAATAAAATSQSTKSMGEQAEFGTPGEAEGVAPASVGTAKQTLGGVS